MKKRNDHCLKTSIILISVLLFSACTSSIQFHSQKPADPRYEGIYTVGVNAVVMSRQQKLELNDRQGRWRVSETRPTETRLNILVRKSLVAHLQAFSNYELIDLHDLRKFQQAFQRLRPVSGERIGEVDMLINVRVFAFSQQQEGSDQEVMTFRQQKSVKRGNKWVKVQDTSRQQVVTVPYSTSQADLIAYVEAIKTKNGEARVLKSFSCTLSSEADPMRSIDAMMNELGVVIAGRILKEVSTYSVVTTREIDKGSDDTVIELMEQGELDEAAIKLEAALTGSEEKNPADLYNLGICYEAFGDPGLALQMYRDAYRRDRSNELYMRAIGGVQ